MGPPGGIYPEIHRTMNDSATEPTRTLYLD